MPLDGPGPPPAAGVAFLDGIQRYAIEAHFGVAPVIRGYVAAAVMERQGDTLRVVTSDQEEMLVVPEGRLTSEQLDAVRGIGLDLRMCEVEERAHPMLDAQRAAELVDHRRAALERRVAAAYRRRDSDAWLVVDGSVAGYPPDEGGDGRLIGLIKSHETQYLEGRNLEVALTLPQGHRSTVFARPAGRRREVHTWYLRLWPWEEHDLLHGLVRVERPASPHTIREATEVSRWLLAERSPLAAPDPRWDRVLYPILQVETYLRAQVGSWW